MHLFIGNLYLWGSIEGYIVSYFHYGIDGNAPDKNATMSAAGMILPFSLLAIMSTMPVGAFLLKRPTDPKLIMTGGSILMIVSIIIASYMSSWWGFILFYSFLFPFGVGIVYWPPIICAWEWFPNRKGLISGLVIGAFGFGAFMFGFITTAICNP